MEGQTPHSNPSHVIRLRGPWRYQAIDQPAADIGIAEPSALRGSCEVPTTSRDLFPPLFTGRVRLERTFGRPTGLESGDTVTLAVLGFDGMQWLGLNGAPLIAREENSGEERGHRFVAEVTSLLLPHNSLAIEIFVEPQASDGRIGEARLEIFSRG